MTNVRIFALPYDSGQRAVRMGCGPDHWLRHGIADALRTAGHTVAMETVEAPEGFHAEIATAFGLYRALAERVRAAGEFPLVLSGNCGAALGALAGLGLAQDSLGVIWFDAHGDFNTPETTASGFLDGMGLATAVGRCWQTIAAGIPGFRPVPEAHIVHVGGRDLDPGERTLLDRSAVTVVEAGQIRQAGVRAALSPALDALRARVQRVYIHFDIDVLDPAEARVNPFPAPPGGLTVGQLEEALRLIGGQFAVAGAGIASYDPACDGDERGLRAGLRLAGQLVGEQQA